MRSSSALRICVLLEWTFVSLGLALSLLLENSLPADLRQWLVNNAKEKFEPYDLLLLGMMILLLICSLVSSIALLFLKR